MERAAFQPGTLLGTSGRKGLQRLQALLGWGGTPVTLRLLDWHIAEDGCALPLTLAARTFRPDIVAEVDAGPELELTVTAAWPVRNTLAVRCEIRNLAQVPRRLTLAFDYPGHDTSPDWQGMTIRRRRFGSAGLAPTNPRTIHR